MKSETIETFESEIADFDYFLNLSVRDRLRNAFIKVHRPGLDDGPPIRSWKTTADYRKWCEENLEPWLGYCSPERVKEELAKIEGEGGSD